MLDLAAIADLVAELDSFDPDSHGADTAGACRSHGSKHIRSKGAGMYHEAGRSAERVIEPSENRDHFDTGPRASPIKGRGPASRVAAPRVLPVVSNQHSWYSQKRAFFPYWTGR